MSISSVYAHCICNKSIHAEVYYTVQTAYYGDMMTLVPSVFSQGAVEEEHARSLRR